VALHEAKSALDNAEQLYKEDSDSPKTRDAAYVATRRAELATVEGETVALEKKKEMVERDAQATNTESTESKLRGQLEQAQRDLQAAQQQARAAMEKLGENEGTSVHEDARGTVITVAGAFLFPTNKADLRANTDSALEKIAFVLKQQPDKAILIEGHTDSTGSDARNLELSKERAEVVGAYLAAHGVSPDKMTVEGAGAANPIANNDTAEGRAANRRVDITIRSDQ